MPNWCHCYLRIKGPDARIDEFLRLVKSERSDFDFNCLSPHPEQFRLLDAIAEEWDKHRLEPGEIRKERPEDGYNQGGYEWCVENWGTKWPASDIEISRTTDLTKVNFGTAWTPPVPVIKKASELFPDLNFELYYF